MECRMELIPYSAFTAVKDTYKGDTSLTTPVQRGHIYIIKGSKFDETVTNHGYAHKLILLRKVTHSHSSLCEILPFFIRDKSSYHSESPVL